MTRDSRQFMPDAIIQCGGGLGRARTIATASIVFQVLLLGGSVVLAQAAASDEAAESKQPQQWALLIGIEKYHRASHLRSTVNDVVQLSKTLRTHGGFPRDHILQITDDAPNPRFQPLRSSLMAELPKWLEKPGPQDTILVYFSGHGFRDAEGKMYLAPIDCDPANPAPTGLPIAWVRQQIAACRAGFKLLIIDACHAGSEKGDDDPQSVPANELGQPFEQLEGVVTLASSAADQKSQIWDHMDQSLFSYWLNQGLKGHADTDSSGDVDIDELYKYVSRNVEQTAHVGFSHEQTPRRIVHSGTAGVPVVVRLRPQGLKQVLADMAEQLSVAIVLQKLKTVGVLEFTNNSGLGEVLGADFGLLGNYCSQELESRLMQLGGGKYSVVDRGRLQRALRNQGFTVDDLASKTSLQRLSSQAGGLPVVAVGTLRNRAGRVLNLQCKLLQTESDEYAGFVGGTALLNESEWAMVGRSVMVKPQDRQPDRPGSPALDQLIERLDRRSEGAHPLVDQNFPYRVKIMIDGTERKGVMRGNQWFVPVRAGEQYEIWIEVRDDVPEPRTETVTLMRLLVDGLNTLPEKSQMALVSVDSASPEEQTKGLAMYRWARPVNLGEARPWELNPLKQKTRVFAVRGFVKVADIDGKLFRFKVVDANHSLAARREFTDQIGMITAAFYAPAANSRSLGTGQGELVNERIGKAEGYKPGNLLGVVHIRYVDAESLDAAGR